MGDEKENPAYHDMTIATLYRMDPEKLKAIRRAMTGMTRCPECDALNRADQKYCDKCGAKLYPELEYEEDKEARKETGDEWYEPDDRDSDETQPDY